MLDGVKIFDLKKFPDERGSFTEIMRTDWKEILGDEIPVQTNLSISFPNVVRGWHQHDRGQIDYCQNPKYDNILYYVKDELCTKTILVKK